MPDRSLLQDPPADTAPIDGDGLPGVPPPAPGARPRPLPLLILETMRPKQWVKNAFVLAGLLFAGEALDLSTIGSSLLAAFAFCLASGATYLLNDALDAEADKHNPRTAGRPIARGDLSPVAALVAAALATVAALALALALNLETGAAIAGFLVLQVAYSNKLKHVLFIDVMAIAAGFVIRAAAGGLAIEVPVSSWLLLCTGLLAIFLGFTKRRGEAVALGGSSQPSRKVLENYSVGLLDELIAVVTPAMVVSYALYAVTGAESDTMLLTVPFVIYGVFRVLFLIHHRPGETEDVALVVWKDRPLLVCVLMWALCAAVIAVVTTSTNLA